MIAVHKAGLQVFNFNNTKLDYAIYTMVSINIIFGKILGESKKVII